MPGCLSTSRFYFPANSIWRQRTQFFTASSVGSPPDLSQRRIGCFPFHQPLGRLRSWTRCRRRYTTNSGSLSPNGPIKPIAKLLGSSSWQRVYNAGARPQRLLWASTGTKDPKASDVLYVKALAAPFTVNTMPEGTLKALAGHNELGAILPADGGDCEEVLAQFTKAGIDLEALATQLQDEGAMSFEKSWKDLISVIASKCDLLKKAS